MVGGGFVGIRSMVGALIAGAVGGGFVGPGVGAALVGAFVELGFFVVGFLFGSPGVTTGIMSVAWGAFVGLLDVGAY